MNSRNGSPHATWINNLHRASIIMVHCSGVVQVYEPGGKRGPSMKPWLLQGSERWTSSALDLRGHTSGLSCSAPEFRFRGEDDGFSAKSQEGFKVSL